MDPTNSPAGWLPESRSEAAIVTTALARASTNLDLPNHVVAAIVGLPEPTIARLRCGTYILQRNEKAFELALLLVGLYQSLATIVGGDDTVAAAWLRNHNTALGGRPVELIQTVGGLLDVIDYLEAGHAS
jgi:hypothetical protein